MNKVLSPLEALNDLRNSGLVNGDVICFTKKAFEIRLDTIEKALKNSEWYKKEMIKFEKAFTEENEEKLKIEQALGIIKEKQIDMYHLKDAIEFEFETDEDAVEFYNQDYGEDFCITVEEFELLKETLK